jgi:hypothetical protein
VAATTSVAYGCVLTGILSLNLMGSMLSLYYQQEYGNFYFLNASAVGQTDLVLKHYSQCSPNTFLNQAEPLGQGTRLLYFQNVQTIESLFMRGEQWQYVWLWALPTLIVIVAVWLLGRLLGFIADRLKHDTSQKAQASTKVLGLIVGFLRDSALILIHVLTINEVALYASASFKIILFGGVNIEWAHFSLSIAVAVYYISYLGRLMVACVRYEGKAEENRQFMLMWACF